MPSQDTVIRIPAFWSKVLAGVMVAVLVTLLGGAASLYVRVEKLELAQSDTVRMAALETVEQVHSVRYEAILDRLEDIQKRLERLEDRP